MKFSPFTVIGPLVMMLGLFFTFNGTLSSLLTGGVFIGCGAALLLAGRLLTGRIASHRKRNGWEFGIIALIALLSYFFQRLDNRETVVVIPEGFSGQIAIAYGMAGAPAMTATNWLDNELTLASGPLIRTSSTREDLHAQFDCRYPSGRVPEDRVIYLVDSRTLPCDDGPREVDILVVTSEFGIDPATDLAPTLEASLEKLCPIAI
ncbi:MAG: hypothetical protein AAGB22_03685 [Bacteroidota bacterium]